MSDVLVRWMILRRKCMSVIVPAIIPQSLEHARASLAAVEGIHEVHIDIVDGKFVTPVSWPIEPSGQPRDIGDMLSEHSVEVDIMTATPLTHAEAWCAEGVDMIVVHTETIGIDEFRVLGETKKNCSIGISALLDTPYETLRPYLEIADYTQVMGIAVIGAQGQPFDERAVARVQEIHRDFPQLPISIDGSINAATIPIVRSLPIERFVVGSAIMAAEKPAAAYVSLKALLNHTS